ncbi:hypothetical protein A6R68_01455 [Neotoma lepida]|uniref:EF-hand domain-containing protein n=1 Tax=Neotoma lepida TaxID=56216 RepID=A0A1A6GVN5_NEOLE|nr:hypothetical protein A6R68_01455 [Neotoma lepida]
MDEYLEKMVMRRPQVSSKKTVLKEPLSTMGCCFPDERLDKMCYKAPIDKKGKFNYEEFTHIFKSGTKDKEDS